MASLADAYATAITTQMAVVSSAEATRPAAWTYKGPLSCSVQNDGTGEVVLNTVSHRASADELLSFAAWIAATFGPEG